MQNDPTPKSPPLPNGADHLRRLIVWEDNVRLESSKYSNKHRKELLNFIGTCLNVLYQAATCYRKCYGGPHILESLCGRAYNLGQSSWALINVGLYDESLALTRNLGEISNLIGMSVVDKEALSQWLAADKSTRIRSFSPQKIRNILKKKEPSLLYADDDWYRSFSEVYVHPTPHTNPGNHGDLSFIGGVFQEAGFDKSLSELSTVLGFISFLVCKYFDFDDMFELLRSNLRNVKEQ